MYSCIQNRSSALKTVKKLKQIVCRHSILYLKIYQVGNTNNTRETISIVILLNYFVRNMFVAE